MANQSNGGGSIFILQVPNQIIEYSFTIIIPQDRQGMPTSTTTSALLATIHTYSEKIRARLTDYGFSRQECDQLFCELLTELQKQRCSQPPHSNTNISGQIAHKETNVAKAIALGIKNSGPKPQIYLISLIGKLEVQLSQLEEYEKLQQKILQPGTTSQVTDKKDEKSETSIKSISDATSEEEVKEQKHAAEKQAQLARLHRQEMAIKCSLKTMIDRTKILRAMLQREVLQRSMNEMEEMSYVPASRFVTLGGFAM